MGDMNAKIGSVNSAAIGDLAFDDEDFAGELLHHLCIDLDLGVPSTMREIHQGQSWTYSGSRGQRTRIDFFAISQECMNAVRTTQVDSSIDVLNGNRDHVTLSMHMQLSIQTKSPAGFKRVGLYDRHKARTEPTPNIHSCIPLIDWRTHVNEHWSQMRDGLQDAARRFYPKPRRQKRQLYFSEEVWDLVCHRKDIRNLHCATQKTLRTMMLSQCFRAWKSKNADHAKASDYTIHQLQMEDAVLFEQKRCVDQRFRLAKKRDWKVWIQTQSEKLANDMKQAKAADIYKILKPKAAIASHSGKMRRPLPGLKNTAGQWCMNKHQIAIAWKKQFGQIEHAVEIPLSAMTETSQGQISNAGPSDLVGVPSVYDLELAIRSLHNTKAPGVDALGTELFQQDVEAMAKRLYPLLLKLCVRGQWVPELAGGWILPLFKGKGPVSAMVGYRAILLESTIARMFSKTWRGPMEMGVRNLANPNQWGGRRGLSCESMHLQARMWQSDVKHRRLSSAIICMDIKQAFYSVAKPLLTDFKGDMSTLVQLGDTLGIPESAMEQFCRNVRHGNLVQRSTGSKMAAAMADATLSRTWFIVQDDDTIQSPQTGSRPGDPLADQLFSLVMATQSFRMTLSRRVLSGLMMRPLP